MSSSLRQTIAPVDVVTREGHQPGKKSKSAKASRQLDGCDTNSAAATSNDQDVDPETERKRNSKVMVYMGGCAGIHHLMFGVGSYIQEHYETDNMVWSTVSGSGYVAACTLMVDFVALRDIWFNWSWRMTDLVLRQSFPFGIRDQSQQIVL